jgi:hypothetical protein
MTRAAITPTSTAKKRYSLTPEHAKIMTLKTSLVWFRRDLRAFDHAALHHALRQSQAVHCVFVYDTAILATLPRPARRLHPCQRGRTGGRIAHWAAT